MALSDHSPPAYTELGLAMEKALPANDSGHAEKQLTPLRAAMPEATATLSGPHNLLHVEKSKEAIAILERGLGACPSASDSDHTSNVILAETTITTLQKALDQGQSGTNTYMGKSISILKSAFSIDIDLRGHPNIDIDISIYRFNSVLSLRHQLAS
jgi:hypothetical protein